ncbi:bifunctional Peptidase C2 [Babesia duncani]|uniref:Bifunctional Peptidase C2 n=1 Tax=Babesia duncani TaxID=323732 RepID=A0AAD9PHL0_9APIC|nr:bifunctional Peptidase C2 [Babesia duncani]KAK2194990.1 bifunctional Peptidase C2 [Babesia duncani]KAK2196467.1 bifunctional Peptidase C2 [Babesia duncani]
MIEGLFPDLFHVCGNQNELVAFFQKKWIANDCKIIIENQDEPIHPIVLKSSVIDGNVMPPWKFITCLPPHVDYKGEIWNDPKALYGLSEKQQRKFARWVRYFDIHKDAKIFTLDICSSRIRQGFVGDCSYLSSLNSLADYEQRFKVPILSNTIHYIDLEKLAHFSIHDLQSPFLVEDDDGNSLFRVGIGVKLHFNGVERCILVDDWVPVRDDGRVLSAHSSDPCEFYITLLEKAFVKILGGTYAVQGTNPGVDIYHLTGWIPEILPVPSSANDNPRHHQELKNLAYHYKWDEIWDSLYAGFKIGVCVLCLGTGSICDATPSGLGCGEGIVADHAYSVLDVKEIIMPNGTISRIIHAKNPWGRISYTLKFSPKDTETWTPTLCSTLGYTPPKKDNGIFWIEWEQILKWFSHLYIVWRPDIFPFHHKLHMTWEPSLKFQQSLVPEDVYFAVFNPQIRLSVDFKNEHVAIIWLMLLQHRKSSVTDFKYLAMHIFKPELIICPRTPSIQGIYNNGECNLFKIIIKKTRDATNDLERMLLGHVHVLDKATDTFEAMILISQYLHKIKEPIPYTLKVYSNCSVRLTPETPIIKNGWKQCVYKGEWNETNSGGSPHSTWQYFTNPHLRLEFTRDTAAVIVLECARAISVNLRIFPGRVATVRALKMGRDIVKSDYKLHCSGERLEFKAGIYTMIPSTFRQGDMAPYHLVLHYEHGEAQISSIPYPHVSSLKDPLLHFKRHKSNKNSVELMVTRPTLMSVKIQECQCDDFVLVASSSAPHAKLIATDGKCRAQQNEEFCNDLSCVACGGPAGRFYPIKENNFSNEFQYDLILNSDLNGGISSTGTVKSAAAQQLYKTQATINFTLVQLLPSRVPYKILSRSNNYKHVYTFTSNQPITIL